MCITHSKARYSTATFWDRTGPTRRCGCPRAPSGTGRCQAHLGHHLHNSGQAWRPRFSLSRKSRSGISEQQVLTGDVGRESWGDGETKTITSRTVLRTPSNRTGCPVSESWLRVGLAVGKEVTGQALQSHLRSPASSRGDRMGLIRGTSEPSEEASPGAHCFSLSLPGWALCFPRRH